MIFSSNAVLHRAAYGKAESTRTRILTALIQSIFLITLMTALAGMLYPYLMPGAKRLVAQTSLLRPFALGSLMIVALLTIIDRISGNAPSTISTVFSFSALALMALELQTFHRGMQLQDQRRVIRRLSVTVVVLLGIRAVAPETFFSVAISFMVCATYGWIGLEAVTQYRKHRQSSNLAIIAIASGIATAAMAARATVFLAVAWMGSATFIEPPSAFLARSVAAASTVVILLFLNHESLARLVQAEQEATDNLNQGLLQSLNQIMEKRTGRPPYLAPLQNACAELLANKLAQAWWPDIRNQKHLPAILRKCTALADIGVIGTPDRLNHSEASSAASKTLAEPGGNSQLIGENLFRSMVRRKPGHTRKTRQSDLFQVAADIAGNHCERWDGAGMPYGKQGRAIPASARIAAAARAYVDLKLARSVSAGRRPISDELHRLRGTSLDPFIVDVLLASEDEFAALIKKIGKAAA